MNTTMLQKMFESIKMNSTNFAFQHSKKYNYLSNEYNHIHTHVHTYNT